METIKINNKNNNAKNSQLNESSSYDLLSDMLEKSYNREVKELFLKEEISLYKTKITYTSMLNIASEYESLIDKNLYDFNNNDVIGMFANQFNVNISSLTVLYSVCTKYVDWAVSRGFGDNKAKTGTNIFKSYNFNKEILPLINSNKFKQKFITEDEIWDMASSSENYQDAICPLLLFYGIRGEDYSEILNLKISDVDIINNTVKIVTEKENRKISLPKKLIDMLLHASREKTYTTIKGTERKLVQSDYIIKPSISRSSAELQASHQIFRRRAMEILKSNGKTNTMLNDIYMSGKIHVLNQIKNKENRELVSTDFIDVNAIFGDDVNNYANVIKTYEMLNDTVVKTTSKRTQNKDKKED